MRLFGFVLLIIGFLLCISIVWAALGFLMMGFGLICLLIAERNRKRAPEADVSDLAADPPIDAAAGPAKTVSWQKPAPFLEPTFAAAPEPEEDWSQPAERAVAPVRVENAGDRWATPRATRSSEFDRIRALRAERGSVRNEPEFRDFSAPVDREPRQPPPPPSLPVQSVLAAAAVQPPMTVAPPIIAEPKAATNEPPQETAPIKPPAPAPAVQTERAILFDDADDLADLFNKFDLGKE